MSRELAFSVTLDDCKVDTFRAGGKGGQNQNKRETGVRVTHKASGAVGEARDERSQLQNKRLAFRRMAETTTFRLWVKRQLGQDDLLKAAVERDMWPVNIKTEVRENGEWVDARN
ncbi:RF-1 peptide chain release factor [Mycobacterium phage Nanosmite]|nr:RF-1 peptide chain release factor [Mycobacterium phage Nanosmite]